MSVIISSLVWDTDLPRSEKMVLLAYATFADHDGRRIFPSQEKIARMTGYSKRSVRRLTRALTAKGYLVPSSDNQGGRGHTNRWRIPIEDGALSPVPIDLSKSPRVCTALGCVQRVPPANPDKKSENPEKREGNADKSEAKADKAVTTDSSVKSHSKPSGNPQLQTAACDPPKSPPNFSKPSGKAGGAQNKREAKRKRQRDSRLDHPAIKAYRAEARLHVPITWRDEVIAAVDDPDRWRDLVHEWIGYGWNKANIKGMLEAYRRGGINPIRPQSGRKTTLQKNLELLGMEATSSRGAGQNEVEDE